MSQEISRRSFLTLVGAVTVKATQPVCLAAPGTLTPLLTAPLQSSGATPTSPVVVRGNARFQILSPSVVRMEYGPTGHFIDALSVSVLDRSWPACPYAARDVNGWVEITTSKMLLKYKLESGEFTAENLTITWSDTDGVACLETRRSGRQEFGRRARRHADT